MTSLLGPQSVLWLGGVCDCSSVSLYYLPKSCLSKMTQELPLLHSMGPLRTQDPPRPKHLHILCTWASLRAY